jgi:hypothetical protein
MMCHRRLKVPADWQARIRAADGCEARSMESRYRYLVCSIACCVQSICATTSPFVMYALSARFCMALVEDLYFYPLEI